MAINTLDMVLVHRMFRHEFQDVLALIDDVPAGDVARAGVVGDHIAFLVSALHHHHAAEDELIWPTLQGRVPGSKTDLDRMADQHEVIAASVHGVEALLAAWTTSADRELAQRLTAAVSELSALVDEHLDDEERTALPIIAKHMRDEEWQAVGKRGASFLSARNMRLGIVLGAMVLGSASEDERQIFMSNVPVPQRLMVQLFGARTMAAYRQRPYGSA